MIIGMLGFYLIFVGIIAYGAQKELKNEPQIQNQISDVSDEDIINKTEISMVGLIFKIIALIFIFLIAPPLIMLLVIMGIGYLIKGIYMRIHLYKKYGKIRFNSVNKITL